MMHRFVALISRRPLSAPPPPAFAVAAVRFQGWTHLLASSRVSAWVIQTAPSQLSHRVLATGCLIGRDFGPALGSADEAWGAFVRIELDPASRRVSVYRDPTGRVDCWRLELAEADVLFSHLDDVRFLLTEPLSVNWDYIQYHLVHDWLRGPETGYREITELLPGETITYRREGPERRLSWRPWVIAADAFPDALRARTTLRAAAERATAAWAGLYDRILLDLSGGLDSAILLGLLRQSCSHRGVVGVNYTTGHPESDERVFAADAARRHGIELLERKMRASDDRREAALSSRLLRPAARNLATLYDTIAIDVLRKTGAAAYFTGTGGDHLFYDYLPIAAACDYRRTRGFDGGLVDISLQLASLSNSTVWHVLAAVLGDVGRRRPDLSALLNRENPLLTDAARQSVDVERFAHPWVQAAADTAPPAKLRQILLIAELQRHYSRYGRADVAEEVHPLFSQPVLEACLRVPAYWFCEGGMPRGLARQTFADLLPPSIAHRRSKGANTALWIEVVRGRLRGARHRLLDGALVAHGLVDRRRLESALADLDIAGSKKGQGDLMECLATEDWLQAATADPANSLSAALG